MELARGYSGVVGALLGLAILANAFSAYFVTQEHYVYFWDWSGYWHMSQDLSEALMHNPRSALSMLIDSVRNSDYNLLPVLPLVPFEYLFGTSRLTYILAITTVALLPGAFIIGLLAQRIIPQQLPKQSLFPLVLATASVLAFHALWAPMLRGLPDVIGVLVIGCILLLNFAKPLAEQSLSHLVTSGMLLCLLVLLRRYYAFWVVAFFPALTVAQCLDIYQRHHGGVLKQYVTTISNAVVIGLTFTIALFVIATPLILRILRTDYSNIYSAYKSSSSLLEAAENLPSYFGWSVIICSLVGLAWLTARKDTRVIGMFLFMQSFIVFALFQRTQDFGPQHYYLLIPDIALGIAVIVVGLWTHITNRLWRSASVGLVFIALLASSASVFYPVAASVTDIFGRLVPQNRFYPQVRNDLNVLSNLLDSIDELELKQRGSIYVLASSVILNSAILQNACKFGHKRRVFCDHILSSNDVDKRDGFPFHFLDASYLVVASPTQYHLRAEDQRVIGILAREVMEGHGIGASFRRLPGEFKLDNGVAVLVFAKDRPFEKTDLEALVNEFAGYYPQMRHDSIMMTTSIRNVILGDKWGKVERIGSSQEWSVHPGESSDTIFEIACQNSCSGDYWANMADIPKEAPPEVANVKVKVKIIDNKNKVLFESVIDRQLPMVKTFLHTDSNELKVYVNNNGTPDYDSLVFGFEVAEELQ